MKLQIALDDITLEEAIALLEKVCDFVDIIEVGTPFAIAYGMEAVRAIRRSFPLKEIICDAKIMDGGRLEAHHAFSAGADSVTVLGVADESTLKAVIQAAREAKKLAVVDLLCVESFEKTIPLLEEMGAEMVAVHVGVDQQLSGRTPLQDLVQIKSIAKNIKVAVAGGISSVTLADYLAQSPDVIIVGSAIIGAADPVAEARKLYEQMQEAG